MSEHEIITVKLSPAEKRIMPKGKKRTTKKANLSADELLKIIKKNERVFHPPAWKWKTLIAFSLGSFGLLLLAFIFSKNSPSEGDIVGLIIFGILAILLSLLGWYKQNKNAFSIRMNAIGMMVTNYSGKTWYPWRTIREIATYTKDMSTQITFKNGQQRNASFVDKMFGFGSTKLPKSYSISHDMMVSQMYQFKYHYKKYELHKHPQLEVEAMKDPPPPTINLLWGRKGAGKNSKKKP